MQVLVLAAQNAVDYEHLGVATSGSTLFRQIGGSIGVSAFGAIFANRLATNLADVLPPGTHAAGGDRPGAVKHLPAAPPRGVHRGVRRRRCSPSSSPRRRSPSSRSCCRGSSSEVPLRATAAADGVGESFASPRDDGLAPGDRARAQRARPAREPPALYERLSGAPARPRPRRRAGCSAASASGPRSPRTRSRRSWTSTRSCCPKRYRRSRAGRSSGTAPRSSSPTRARRVRPPRRRRGARGCASCSPAGTRTSTRRSGGSSTSSPASSSRHPAAAGRGGRRIVDSCPARMGTGRSAPKGRRSAGVVRSRKEFELARYVRRSVVVVFALALTALVFSGGAAAAAPDLGPNVYVFNASMPTSQIQATVDAIATQQVPNQFGTAALRAALQAGHLRNRVAAPQLPGRLLHRGRRARQLPDDVVINGSVYVRNQCAGGNCIALEQLLAVAVEPDHQRHDAGRSAATAASSGPSRRRRRCAGSTSTGNRR